MLTNSVAADGQTPLTGAIKGANGTASAPSYSFGSDTNIGIYRKGADQLGFATAGTECGYFDSDGGLVLAAGLTVSGDMTADNFNPSEFIETLLDDADAATARATLGIATATESAEGLVEQATDAEVRSAASGAKAIMAADLESAAAAVALSDAATVAVDWDAGINFTLTVTADRAIGNPTNGQPGTHRTIMVQGNNTTDRAITFGNQFLGDTPTITDCDSGRWYLLTIYCHATDHFVVSAKRAK